METGSNPAFTQPCLTRLLTVAAGAEGFRLESNLDPASIYTQWKQGFTERHLHLLYPIHIFTLKKF